MAYTAKRSRAQRSSFSSMADQLYPEDDRQGAVMGGPEAGDAQEGASDTNPTQPMSQRDMADKVYPAERQGTDKTQSPPEDQDEGEVEDDGDGDDGPENEGAPAEGENGPAAQSGADRLHAVVRMFGVKGEPGSKEAEALAKLQAGVRKAIAEVEARKGVPLTPDEEQNITGQYIADHAMKWLRLRKIGADRLSDAMWKGAGQGANEKCGIYFRKHFEALGGSLDERQSGSVKDWGPELQKNGYEPISMDAYEPQDGDIRIYGAVTPRDPKNPKAAEIHGHIQVYNAKQKRWVSEYQQNQDTPPAFQRRDAKFVTYRFNPL